MLSFVPFLFHYLNTSYDDFKNRFKMGLTEEKLVEHVDALMTASLDSARTVLYDRFQYYSNGIRE